MPHYHLDRYFVPDDKDVYDMLHACNTSHDKLWGFARNYGILTSPTEPRPNLIDEISRLTMDRRKLQEIFLLNSTKDREDKFSSKTIQEEVTMERMKAVAATVQQSRAATFKEEYTFIQPSENEYHVKVAYREPDLSRAEAIQTREKEITIQIVKSEGKISIRHHSNEKAVEVVKSLVEKLAAANGEIPKTRTIDFSGIKNATQRTKFFTDLAKNLTGFKLADVPSLKVHRLPDNQLSAGATENIDADKEAISAQVRKIFLSGTDLMRCPEYTELEKRGFFISSISWIAEHDSETKEHYEFSAEFTSAEVPVDIKYGCSGKYTRSEDSTLKKYKTNLSAVERNDLLNKLEVAAFKVYDSLVDSTTTGAPTALAPLDPKEAPDGNKG